MSQVDTNNLLQRILDKQQLLYDMLIEAYSYMPVVYTQQNVPTGTEKENVYVIKTHLDRLPDNGLLFILPKYTSTTDTVKLKVLFEKDASKAIIYTVYLENTDGNLIKAGANSLVANRLAMFRIVEQFIPKSSNDATEINHMVVLTNNPFYNNLAVSKLKVTNETVFHKMPIFLPETIANTTEVSKGFEFVLYADYIDLLNRVKTLENRLVIGTEDVEEVADTLQEGQIYMKVENIEV